MPFPAELEVVRTVTSQGLVAFRGNHFSVPPGQSGAQATVAMRLGDVPDRAAVVSLQEQLRGRVHRIALGWVAEKLHLLVQIVRRSDGITGFVLPARRWTMERRLGWLLRSRRFVRD